MALVIEDGTIVSGANSLITVVELTAYIEDRGYTLPTALEPLCIRSYDYIKGLPFKDGLDTAFTVTDNHKNAQCEIAYRFSTGLDPFAQPKQSVKRKKTDILETEYFSSTNGQTGASFLNYMPLAESYLKDLIVTLPMSMDRH